MAPKARRIETAERQPPANLELCRTGVYALLPLCWPKKAPAVPANPAQTPAWLSFLRRYLGGELPRGPALLIAAVASLHAVLLVRGILAPESILNYDRGRDRLNMAVRLIDAVRHGDAWTTLGQQTVIGDYLPHALMYALAGGWLPGVPFLQLAIHLWALRELYRLANRAGATPAQAWWSVATWAAIPIDLCVPHHMASESVFLPLVIASMRQAADAAFAPSQKERDRGALMAGLWTALATLCRPEWQLPALAVAAAVAVYALRGGLQRLWSAGLRFAAPFALVVGAWLLVFHAASGQWGFGAAGVDLRATVAVRVQEIVAYSGQPLAPGEDPGALQTWVSHSLSAPQTALRVAISHMAKFVALPENLDIPAYFGLYERTGVRAVRLEQLGFVGAAVATLREMPVLTSWLLFEIALFLWYWTFVMRGGALIWRERSDTRLFHLALWAIVLLYVGERFLMEGGSRKRTPIDMILALAAGYWLGRRALGNRPEESRSP